MTSTRLRTVITAICAAVAVYLLANAVELLLIRAGARGAVVIWLSDLLPALAFGLATALWLDLRATRAARTAAEDASRAKDEVLAIVAHELRNPLTAISAAFQVLEVAPTDEARQRPREVIVTQAGYLSRMIEDLFDLGSVTNGKVQLRRVALDLAAVVRRAVDNMRHAGKLDHHDVKIQGETAWVYADGLRIEQIVVNLISNAVKYTPAGGSIDVATSTADRDVVLRVADTGAGISRELLPGVFSLFVQGQQPRGRQAEGLGIGLSLVRRLVELHGGTVQASSDGAGCGTTIEVRLPRLSETFPLMVDASRPQGGVEHRVN